MLNGLVAYHEGSVFHNKLMKEICKGMVEVTQRKGRRGKQLPDDLKEIRRYWPLKEEGQDRSAWRTCFGRSYGLVLRQNIINP